MTLKLFFDGGCRPNPGRMEAAVVVRGRTHHWADLGQGTSGEAEWIALLRAMGIAAEMGADDVTLIGDSTTIVEQAAGRWKCRSPDLARHRAAFVAAAEGFTRVHIRHVRRSRNLAGIALDRRRAGLAVTG